MPSPIKLVVEELAPGAKFSAVVRRMLQYLKSGVPLVLLVDNVDRCVTVYRKGDSSDFFMEGEVITGLKAFSGPPVSVSEFLTPAENV
jgi:hypothetical protein